MELVMEIVNTLQPAINKCVGKALEGSQYHTLFSGALLSESSSQTGSSQSSSSSSSSQSSGSSSSSEVSSGSVTSGASQSTAVDEAFLVQQIIQALTPQIASSVSAAVSGIQTVSVSEGSGFVSEPEVQVLVQTKPQVQAVVAQQESSNSQTSSSNSQTSSSSSSSSSSSTSTSSLNTAEIV